MQRDNRFPTGEGYPVVFIDEDSKLITIAGDFFTPFPQPILETIADILKKWFSVSVKVISLDICLRDFNTSVARGLVELSVDLDDWAIVSEQRHAYANWYYCEDNREIDEEVISTETIENGLVISNIFIPKNVWERKLKWGI